MGVETNPATSPKKPGCYVGFYENLSTSSGKLQEVVATIKSVSHLVLLPDYEILNPVVAVVLVMIATELAAFQQYVLVR